MFYNLLLLIYISLFVLYGDSFIHLRRPVARSIYRPLSDNNSIENEKLVESMEKARQCANKGLSPGAGLATADEQSDAAYADLINTSMDQRGIRSLSEDDLAALEQGGKMWEKGSKDRENKLGLFGDLANLLGALSGGAHIEKNKYGET